MTGLHWAPGALQGLVFLCLDDDVDLTDGDLWPVHCGRQHGLWIVRPGQ